MPAARIFRSVCVAITVAIFLAGCATQTPYPVTSINRLVSTDLSTVLQEADLAADSVGVAKVLVIFDIDNTLLAMGQDLGSDQWYDWQKVLQQHDRCDERLVADRLATVGALFFASGMRPTQHDAAAIVRAIQDRGFSVMALTSRGSAYRLATFRELRRGGFNFRDSAPGPRGGYQENYMPEGGARPVRYEDGVMLTAGQHKGEMLASLLAKTAHPGPEVIIVVDDKVKNLDNYTEYASKNDVSLVAIEYTGEADVIANFDGEEATRQWRAIVAALDTLQSEIGTDHFELPDSHLPEGCPVPQ